MTMMVAGTFKNQADAEQALYKLEDMGIRTEQVSFVSSEETRSNFRYKDGDNSDDGAAAGATAGGIGGAIFGAVATTGALLIPGLNVIVSGALVGALTGLAVGAGTGGIIGALVGFGLSEEDAEIYETEIKRGGIMVTVQADNEMQRKEIARILKKADARDIAA